MKSIDNPSLPREIYLPLVNHYEACFTQHGPTHEGVDWPNEHDVQIRHNVMRDLWAHDPSLSLNILDLGCGYGGFLDFLNNTETSRTIHYTGIDLSSKMVQAAQKRHPDTSFMVQDILHSPLPCDAFEYGVMNGVLTEKQGLSFDEMERFSHAMISALFKACRHGIAFNMMSHHVEWERPDLFHMPFDRLANFLTNHCSRHFRICADYGLYEYTVYLYRHPQRLDHSHV